MISTIDGEICKYATRSDPRTGERRNVAVFLAGQWMPLVPSKDLGVNPMHQRYSNLLTKFKVEPRQRTKI